jgi:hypothetical protein
MKKAFRNILFILLTIIAVYYSWSYTGRQVPSPDTNMHLDTTYIINSDLGKGNLLGINPYMTPLDYASKENFRTKIGAYLQDAKRRGWLNPKTVVIYPEYIGSWLVVANEKTSIYKSPTMQKAISTFILSNAILYIRDWFTAPDDAKDKIKHAVFASKSETMSGIYKEVFSGLAKEYHVSIVAGSILLPNAEFHKDHIDTWKGSLYNISGVFDTAGKLEPLLVKKAYPTSEEQPFVAAGKTSESPTFQLPAGRTSVLICADSWYPDSYTNMNKDGALLVAVPSYTQSDGSMQMAWTGYSSHPTPKDVDTSDIGRISLREAWLKYTIPNRLKGKGRYGMCVSLRGRMWDLGSDGEIIAVNGENVFCGPPLKGASMACMWIK